ncbi:sugar phosphate nucleotidyltransferase [Anoxybacillus sp. J5B_2022]|uniref:sugar phosphate nucleotidyltransferase n=1 Tax=Anoxybacillus sp. J5B_2022 TaxID=3003246 RepID=UPI0022868CDF|nr:sugar phosphate nucleotidyltransferase [Anoxybacillus sp. J5B_2022]MCZ0754617.1 sugar phosphate nucleotidyltransferase [Anoxybacillus sp. J5B_2022]
MKGIIMAGGRGTRLRPLTCDVPKPMVPLVGKPVLEYTIEWLKRFGVTDIAITIHYLGETIKQYFGDGSRFGVNICYFEEQEPLGTAGSIKHAESFIDDTFVVVSGDALTDVDLSEAIAFHRDRHALATIVTSQQANPLDYGGIIAANDGKVKQLIEKPKWNEVYSDFVNTGIYIFERDILQHINENETCDFSSDIFPMLLKNDAPLYAFLAKGYWLDIGTIQQYRKAHIDILNKHVHVSINGKELFPHVWVGADVQIEDGAVIIGPAFIGDGACIRKNVKIEPYTVIGANVQIGEHTSVKRSVIWDRVYIGRYCELRGSLLAGDTYVANHVELLEQSVIGSHCTIQPNVQVKPTIKIWPKKTIGEGTVVHSSLFWGKQALQPLFGTRGISGVANVEMTPEYVTKLGAAYGSTLPLHSHIIVAGDGHPFTNLMKQAFAQGLHTSGICTAEWQEGVTAPVVRYHLSQSPYAGGVYIFLEESEQKVYIDLYDEHGYPLDRFREKAVEHAFVQEKLRRVSLEQIGFSNYELQPSTSYIQAIHQHIALPLCHAKAIFVSDENVYRLVEQLLHDQQCDMAILKNAPLHELSEYLKTTNALFALIAKNDGEQFLVMDEKGNILTEEQLFFLYTIISLWFRADRSVPIPNYAPSTLEVIASRLNGQVKRVEGTRREILRAWPHPFHFLYDAVFAFVQLLQLFAVEARPLSQVIASIPRLHWLKDYVFCPWNARAVVMRKLMEDEIETNLDVSGGIKVWHPDGGWTFILPELDQPIFTIYSEAFDGQKARETVTRYIKKIRQYQNV